MEQRYGFADASPAPYRNFKLSYQMLSGKQLKKTVGGKLVLSGIDCALYPGKITVLIGLIGEGNRQLLRILTFVESAD